MRAVTWQGRHKVQVDTVPDPEIVNPRDAIIKITSTAICGSDLHLYDGYIPTMRAGDILGHENMGEVVEVDVRDALREMTGGIGPDACIDCVGMESHGLGIDNVLDTVKAHTFLGTERPAALRQAILSARKGGRVSVPGVYGGFMDKFPLGAFMEKGLTMKTGQTHVQRYTKPLLELIQQGKIDTTYMISHRASLEDGPAMYKNWHSKQDEYTKIVLKPDMAAAA